MNIEKKSLRLTMNGIYFIIGVSIIWILFENFLIVPYLIDTNNCANLIENLETRRWDPISAYLYHEILWCPNE